MDHGWKVASILGSIVALFLGVLYSNMRGDDIRQDLEDRAIWKELSSLEVEVVKLDKELTALRERIDRAARILEKQGFGKIGD